MPAVTLEHVKEHQKRELYKVFLELCAKGKVAGCQRGVMLYEHWRKPDFYACDWCDAEAETEPELEHKNYCYASRARELLQNPNTEKGRKLAEDIVGKLLWHRITGSWRYACPTCDAERGERQNGAKVLHANDCIWYMAYQLC